MSPIWTSASGRLTAKDLALFFDDQGPSASAAALPPRLELVALDAPGDAVLRVRLLLEREGVLAPQSASPSAQGGHAQHEAQHEASPVAPPPPGAHRAAIRVEPLRAADAGVGVAARVAALTSRQRGGGVALDVSAQPPAARRSLLFYARRHLELTLNAGPGTQVSLDDGDDGDDGALDAGAARPAALQRGGCLMARRGGQEEVIAAVAELIAADAQLSKGGAAAARWLPPTPTLVVLPRAALATWTVRAAPAPPRAQCSVSPAVPPV